MEAFKIVSIISSIFAVMILIHRYVKYHPAILDEDKNKKRIKHD